MRRSSAGAALAIIVAHFVASSAMAAPFSSGSTGADGAFNPSCSPTPCSVQVTLPNSGVFNFTTVNVPTGVTVTFTHNGGNTPVTMLATGDVTIEGTIDVSGTNAPDFGRHGVGGPGGFDGGEGGSVLFSKNGARGLGPGGGGPGSSNGCGGSFGSGGGGCGAAVYGSPQLVPLIGGSGGGGGGSFSSTYAGGGGGGGGAVLIASSGTITVDGSMLADGGTGFNPTNCGSIGGGGGAGSGGGIRLVANRITGIGAIRANGGAGGCGFAGGVGRIRIESSDIELSGSIGGSASSSSPRPVNPSGQPMISIVSVDGGTTPPAPQGSFDVPPDITLSPTVTNPMTVTLQASNVPVGTLIAVTLTAEGASPTTVNSTPLSGTFASSTATASVTVPNGNSIVSASATFVQQ